MVAVNSYTAEHTDALLAEVRLGSKTFVRKTATYAPVVGDTGKVIEMNLSAANDVVISLDADVDWADGAHLEVTQRGTGVTTILAAMGVTINSPGGLTDCAAQYGRMFLDRVGPNEWYLYGDLA